jgi:SAM-dependent methyltransferase
VPSSLPRPIKRAAAGVLAAGRSLALEARCAWLDLGDLARGDARPITPPRRLWSLVGAGPERDFHAPGAHARALLEQEGLASHHRVLDVGCGIGRLATQLTEVIGPEGGYEGFDIMPQAIAWCARAITPRHPQFHFQLADVHSDRYHPAGRQPASAYRFPYPDASFDFVFLGSVFTHMFAPDLENYLSEIARVLKPGGRCVISYYVLNPDRRAVIAPGRSAFTFAHATGGGFAEYAALPEAAIAFEEDWLRALYAKLGLAITRIELGQWPATTVQDQDLIVAART